jgi:hypothetical protein
MARKRWRGTSASVAALIWVHHSEPRHGRKETFTSQARVRRRQNRRKKHGRAKEILGHAAPHARGLFAVEDASPVKDYDAPRRRSAKQTDRYAPPQTHEARGLIDRFAACRRAAVRAACDYQKIRGPIQRQNCRFRNFDRASTLVGDSIEALHEPFGLFEAVRPVIGEHLCVRAGIPRNRAFERFTAHRITAVGSASRQFRSHTALSAL